MFAFFWHDAVENSEKMQTENRFFRGKDNITWNNEDITHFMLERKVAFFFRWFDCIQLTRSQTVTIQRKSVSYNFQFPNTRNGNSHRWRLVIQQEATHKNNQCFSPLLCRLRVYLSSRMTNTFNANPLLIFHLYIHVLGITYILASAIRHRYQRYEDYREI